MYTKGLRFPGFGEISFIHCYIVSFGLYGFTEPIDGVLDQFGKGLLLSYGQFTVSGNRPVGDDQQMTVIIRPLV